MAQEHYQNCYLLSLKKKKMIKTDNSKHNLLMTFLATSWSRSQLEVYNLMSKECKKEKGSEQKLKHNRKDKAGYHNPVNQHL